MIGDAELDYGNARVRAMRSRMLSPEALERLLEHGMAELAAALGTTDYGADLERDVLHRSGLGLIHAALRSNLARTFGKLRRSYDGDAARSLELLLSRWDATNLITLARGHARRAMPEDMLALVLPLGRLDDATLGALARLPGLRALVEQLVAWRIPSAAGAARILEAWPEYEKRGVAVLEHRIRWAYVSEAASSQREDWLAPEVARLLRMTTDADNVMVTLRLWEARESGEPGQLARWAALPGGTLQEADLLRAETRSSRSEVAGALLHRGKLAWAAEALGQWVREGNLPTLERQLSAGIFRCALRGFGGADPLSLAVPVAFIYARDNEVRNLRLIAEAAAGRLDPDLVRVRWLVE